MPSHLKKSINQVHLENGTKEKIVTHLKQEKELNGLKASDELQINTMSQKTTNTNTDGPKPTCHQCKKSRHYKHQCHLVTRLKKQSDDIQNQLGNKNSGANNSILNKNTNNNKDNNYKINKRAERKPKTFYPPCETCGKTNHSTEKCYHGANAANRPPPWHRRQERQNQVQV